MNSTCLESLMTVAHDVLRVTAYALPEPWSKTDLVNPIERILQAKILFEGDDSHGEMNLTLGRELCTILAGDILSEDYDQVTDVQVDDSLKELLNIVCGQWLTTVYGVLPVFALSVPTIQPADKTQWRSLCESPDSVGLVIDDEAVLITVKLFEAVPEVAVATEA